MSLEHILLGLLQEPASGYDLKKLFDSTARHFWAAELNQIYPTLKRLEKQGWLTREVQPSAKGPPRKVYRRTEAGREELLRWLRGGPVVGNERNSYLAQLFFLHEVGDPKETRAFLTRLRAYVAARYQQLQDIERLMAEEEPGFPDRQNDAAFHAYLSLRMGLTNLAARLAWCDETIQRVERRRGRSR